MAETQEVYENPTKEIKKPSKLWYLLPIFLSIIGGIVGYIVIKDRNRKMARNILIIGFIALVIGVVLGFSYTFMGSQLMTNVRNVSVNKPASNQSADSLCADSGGTIVNKSCCQQYGDFASTCLIAPCACQPEYAHVVRDCECGSGKCWDPTRGCIKI